MNSLQNTSVQFIKGVGPARKRMFVNLGVETVEDLLYLFPRRYEDRTQMTPIAQLEAGQWAIVSGKVANLDARKSWFTKKHVYELVVDDGQGRLTCVWFNQPYLAHYFKDGMQVVLYGKTDIYKNRLQMVSPEYEIISSEEDFQLSVGRIVPIYPLTRGMTQRYLRKVVHNCLERYKDEIEDVLPVPIRNKYRLSNIKRSLQNIHFPESLAQQEAAVRRVSFEEFFFFQVSVFLRRLSITTKDGFSHNISQDFVAEFTQSFPFPLTSAQKNVIDDIAEDMRAGSPMLRLLQGDVGSGKTLVALFGCVAAWQNGQQAAIMAPTEILARQHYQTIQSMLESGPFKEMKIAFLVSNLKKKEKDAIYLRLKKGEIDLLIGTHALLSEQVDFKHLSFVVIDEQHKFGVRQRALLSSKGTNPDVLIMTATPIPRTLCMTLYGDLDVSIINEMPPGRGTITTKLYSLDQAQEVYALVREKVAQGQQAYIVYPIIEESETLNLKAAQKMFEHFKKHEFKDLRLGLVHGQMDRKNTDQIMGQFKNKQIDILLATTILEVGVDVPNANVMIVEHADRFGLAQLHQLRGRVGRGQDDALCLLISDPNTEGGNARLEAILSSNDGFKIAESDLMIRGPGQYFGRHQHGLNELRVANPATQIDILEEAREEAKALANNDPTLTKKEHQRIKEVIRQRYPTYLAMVEAG